MSRVNFFLGQQPTVSTVSHRLPEDGISALIRLGSDVGLEVAKLLESGPLKQGALIEMRGCKARFPVHVDQARSNGCHVLGDLELPAIFAEELVPRCRSRPRLPEYGGCALGALRLSVLD